MNWTRLWDRFAPRRLIVYADFIDPFCYIGFHNASRAAAGENIALDWRGFELNPETPEEGSYLVSTPNSDLRPAMWASVKDFAKKSGLDLLEPTQVPNTRLAHLWVQTVRKGDVKNSLIGRIYQAYLSDKKNIGEGDVLLDIARDMNLPEEPLERLAAARDASPLEHFRRQAVDYEFPGMPGFSYRGKTYFGALSEEAWRTILNGKE